MKPESLNLLAALGNMRFRMEPRLKVAGMELQWDARNLPEEVDIDPNGVLPVLRIVRHRVHEIRCEQERLHQRVEGLGRPVEQHP